MPADWSMRSSMRAPTEVSSTATARPRRCSTWWILGMAITTSAPWLASSTATTRRSSPSARKRKTSSSVRAAASSRPFRKWRWVSLAVASSTTLIWPWSICCRSRASTRGS